MALHKVAVAAKDGASAAIPGGIQQHDSSGTGAGPNQPLLVNIDSTGAEIFGTTADAVWDGSASAPSSYSLWKYVATKIEAVRALLAGSVAVTGTFWQTTQPVSLASVPSHAVTNAGTFAVQAAVAPGTTETKATSATIGSGGVGYLGWLSTIAAALAGTLTVATHAVTQSGSWVLSAGSALIGVVKIGDGTNSAAIKAASTAASATDPALVVTMSPNGINSNGLKTAANSAPVVAADGYGEYETVAASQTAQVLGATGATGDYLAGVLVFPGTAGCGVVTILDNATTIGTFAGGGTTALPSLVPFLIPVGLFSVSGAWKITTGANVTAVGIGNFT